MTIELPDFITVPAGPFLMGTPASARAELARRYGGTSASYAEELPQHSVTLAAFAIAAVPVTNALYAAFVAATGAEPPVTWRGPAPPPALADHPVVDASWLAAQQFCAWLSQTGGPRFRLPTEAEWEKAARGTDGRAFPWGDDFDPQLANTREVGIGATTPAGSLPGGASPYGVLDLAGNVWEWTQSRQAAYPYADDGRNESDAAPLRRRWWQRPAPPAASPDLRRILRGGCYVNPEGFARCACRLRLLPAQRTPFLGFRLVRDGDPGPTSL